MRKKDFIHEHLRETVVTVMQMQYVKITKAKKPKQVMFNTLKGSLEELTTSKVISLLESNFFNKVFIY